ncbi:MAG: hypothetical protein WCK09_21155 [Bacteroidota bacterium]
MKSVKIGIILLICTFTISVVQAQLAISPPYVSVDGRSGVGTVYIINNSEEAQEIEISFAFGYPASDAEGNMVMNYNDSTAYKQYAMDPVVRAFPRTFILAAKQQRAVRVQVKPTPGMKDGFYFTRAKILAKPQTADVSKPAEGGLSTNIKFNFEQVIPAFYRRGKVTTGLKIEKVYTDQKDTLLVIKAQVDRLGEAPFIGSMIAKLKDNKGKVVATAKSSTAVYFNALRRIDLGISKITPGPYILELTFETKRGDMAVGDLVQAQPISETIELSIK